MLQFSFSSSSSCSTQRQLQSSFFPISSEGKFFSILNCQNGLRILDILYEKELPPISFLKTAEANQD